MALNLFSVSCEREGAARSEWEIDRDRKTHQDSDRVNIQMPFNFTSQCHHGSLRWGFKVSSTGLQPSLERWLQSITSLREWIQPLHEPHIWASYRRLAEGSGYSVRLSHTKVLFAFIDSGTFLCAVFKSKGQNKTRQNNLRSYRELIKTKHTFFGIKDLGMKLSLNPCWMS